MDQSELRDILETKGFAAAYEEWERREYERMIRRRPWMRPQPRPRPSTPFDAKAFVAGLRKEAP